MYVLSETLINTKSTVGVPEFLCHFALFSIQIGTNRAILLRENGGHSMNFFI